MTHSTNQGLGRQSALTRRSFVAGASVLAAGMLLGGPFGCSAPAEEGAADTSIEAEAQATGKAADLVFKNGHVQTLVNEGDVAQAVAVRGGDIVYVGDDAGIEAFVGDATKVIDLGGKFDRPGIRSVHLRINGRPQRRSCQPWSHHQLHRRIRFGIRIRPQRSVRKPSAIRLRRVRQRYFRKLGGGSDARHRAAPLVHAAESLG